MKIVEQTFNDVIKSTESISLDIKCQDKKWQESIRMAAYAYKRKLPSILVDDIGISRITENNEYYIRIYKAPPMTVYKVGADGNRTKHKLKNSLDTPNPEDERIIELMRKDGKTDEEIEEFLNQQ